MLCLKGTLDSETSHAGLISQHWNSELLLSTRRKSDRPSPMVFSPIKDRIAPAQTAATITTTSYFAVL